MFAKRSSVMVSCPCDACEAVRVMFHLCWGVEIPYSTAAPALAAVDVPAVAPLVSC